MELEEKFRQLFNRAPSLLVRAPGRVNLLGEHIDYNDGPVLPAAINRAVQIAAAPASEPVVHLHALDLKQEASFQLDELEAKKDIHGKPLPHWAIYPAAVAWALKNAGFEVRGIQAIYHSDIPIGAGLSSSAAVEVGFAILWQTLGTWRADRMTIARLCQRAENGYVGVSCGLMDQFASANGVADHALYFDTRSLEWEAVPLPPGTAIVIADSGIRRSLATSSYNERRAACEAAVEILKETIPGLHSLRDVSPTEFAAYSDRLPENIRKRAEHVVKEIARVESARSALIRQDARAFGALMYAGHASLRDLYEVSTPELDTLVTLARELPSCLGARLTGAGFGGCTVNLVMEDQAQAFVERLKVNYQEKTQKTVQVYVCQASDGASVQSLEKMAP